jgi:aryl-alcohol dehydrogenase-like predicted oxidoreductase
VETRQLGRTGRRVGAIGLGCWQLGADWGTVEDAEALAVLAAAVEAGVTLLDTADVYGDGRSERLIGRFLRANPGSALTVATKFGRRANPHIPAAFTAANLRGWADRSRTNLGVERLDLVQLHCPPTEVYSMDDVFDALDTLVADGVVAAYGVSVETCDEALAAIARSASSGSQVAGSASAGSGVATVQIILNALRHKPLERVLPAAVEAGVGIIARVPLASGLLSGRYDATTTFAADDHRSYNRHGEAFDVGETFSGVPFDVGLAAVQDLAALTPDGASTAAFALRWVLDQPGVSVVIPGARSPEQARANAAAADLAPLHRTALAAVRAVYDDRVRGYVHHRW